MIHCESLDEHPTIFKNSFLFWKTIKRQKIVWFPFFIFSMFLKPKFLNNIKRCYLCFKKLFFRTVLKNINQTGAFFFYLGLIATMTHFLYIHKFSSTCGNHGWGFFIDQPARLHLGSPKSELSISSFPSIRVRLLIIVHPIYKKSVKVSACTEAHIIFIIQQFE